MHKVIIIGGIGSGTVVAQAMLDAQSKGYSSFLFEGFMSHEKSPGEFIEDMPVVASQNVENIKKFYKKGYKFLYVLHRTDKGDKFVELFKELQLHPEMLATFIHPSVYIAPNVLVQPGSIIMPYAMLSSHAEIGLNTLIMTGATIGHNTKMGMFNHIASQAVVGAYIETSIGVHIGLNSTIREYIKIGHYSTLGMGSVLTKDIGEKEVWAGNPAKFLRKAE